MKARPDPNVQAHLEWLGFVQPTGLVFSAPALVRAGAILPRSDPEGQRLLQDCVEEWPLAPGEESEPVIADFERFARDVLGWSFHPSFYAGVGGSELPPELELALPEQEETIRPDLAVRERDPERGAPEWQLLVNLLSLGEPFDHGAHSRLERLLRHTDVPAGLLFNGCALRLISAPRGESAGWLEFRVKEMTPTAGRPIASALRLLLSEPRLLTLPRKERLTALLQSSRAFQNEVSEKLAEQVLHALYELLRGFQAANDASGGRLLQRVLAERSDDVYRALLTVILRIVFLLYAEERDMLPEDETFVRHYSLAALYERLRADHASHSDTMSQRYGAWAQLLALFRMIHDGARAPQLHMPPRHGALFDPDRFPFLEGRPVGVARQRHERIDPPLVPDGTVFRALDKLLVLDGERISYRALDVEQIGSVYETMMGFRLETAIGRSVAVRAQSRYGAPTTVSLDELLRVDPGKRAKWVQDNADRKLTPRLQAALEGADRFEELHAALAPVVDRSATPDVVPTGAMVLQPSEERRKSGSHYTPRSLTEPIVRTTLQPVLDVVRDDGRPPTPAQILELKVCDPAMGSGAFLVEACRRLGDGLVEAWKLHGGGPELPPDEDEVTFARRLVAQRCLYGVDRNEVAVDLAKMSLWLATLAREHPFTFLDHALRHGDSLVGLTRRQIEAFHWKPQKHGFEAIRIGEHLEQVRDLRRQIREASDDVSDQVLRHLWDQAQFELRQVRLYGDLVVTAFFLGAKDGERERKRAEFADAVAHGEAKRYGGLIAALSVAEPPLVPFHWEVELPEVFDRSQPGFDAIVGNPPFMAGMRISALLSKAYLDWLYENAPNAGSRADLVVYFFRRAFRAIRVNGCFGLLATNTIAQGDTRTGGLSELLREGGHIFAARKRIRWPGTAAVIVSAIHVIKDGDHVPAQCFLDGKPVKRISSYLLPNETDHNPIALARNQGRCFSGVYPYGAGFLFQDNNEDSTPVAVMDEILALDPEYKRFVHPYLGGEEFLIDPEQRHCRYVIDFDGLSETEARQWPQLMAILEKRVKPFRAGVKRKAYRDRWWVFAEPQLALRRALVGRTRVLMHPFTSSHLAFAFVPATTLVGQPHLVVIDSRTTTFAVLQSRANEVWVRFTSSTLEDRLSYKVSDSLETFPFPEHWESDPELDAAGRAYYEHRAALMVRNDEGLTKTYNRFHDQYERDPGIERLRELHTEMDRAVLSAYGWDDVPIECEFLLDYEIDEEEWGKKRKPYRYRWPDAVRDDVLARLMALNEQRAAEEQRSGAAAAQQDGGGQRRTPLSVQAEELF